MALQRHHCRGALVEATSVVVEPFHSFGEPPGTLASPHLKLASWLYGPVYKGSFGMFASPGRWKREQLTVPIPELPEDSFICSWRGLLRLLGWVHKAQGSVRETLPASRSCLPPARQHLGQLSAAVFPFF